MTHCAVINRPYLAIDDIYAADWALDSGAADWISAAVGQEGLDFGELALVEYGASRLARRRAA